MTLKQRNKKRTWEMQLIHACSCVGELNRCMEILRFDEKVRTSRNIEYAREVLDDVQREVKDALGRFST